MFAPSIIVPISNSNYLLISSLIRSYTKVKIRLRLLEDRVQRTSIKKTRVKIFKIAIN